MVMPWHCDVPKCPVKSRCGGEKQCEAQQGYGRAKHFEAEQW